MHPIYKFELQITGQTARTVYPLYSGNLAKEYALESGQQFFRASLSGNLTFLADDYDYIVGKAIDTQFNVTIYISYNAGSSWSVCWTGQFWKTDCTFDEDAETVEVKPQLRDVYTAVLNGMEKEFDLIQLAPAMEQIKLDKRPMVQVYVPGETVIGCFLSGMGWEQECEAVTDTNKLVNDYHFYNCKSRRNVEVSGSMSPSLPNIFWGAPPANETGTYNYTASGFKFQQAYGNGTLIYSIIRTSDNTTLWQKQSGNVPPPTYPNEVVLTPVSGSGATGNVKLYIHDTAIYSRYVCDVESINGTQTYPIPADDIVENNRNYKRVVGYDFPDTIIFSSLLSTSPTPYGLYQPGQYYQMPASASYYGQMFPIAKSTWGRLSIWFAFSSIDWLVEQYARAPYVLNDAYTLAGAISVLLNEIAPSVSHSGTTTYSQFLYGSNPVTGITTVPIITPKSNIINSGYDQPAQKAPITLKQIFDMLRDVFRCYWWIDSSNRLRIEHISYFRNGMAYSGSPAIGADLTTMAVSRNGKKWAFGKNVYKFDKPDMAARYEFGWMDDCTELFDGYPIDIVSKFVQQDKIENIQVQQFTSDVDYILLNPSAISKDGFVLMLCQQTSYDTQTWEYFLDNAISTEIPAGTGVDNVIDLSQYIGKTISLVVSIEAGTQIYGYAKNAQGQAIQVLGSIFEDDGTKEWNFVVPVGSVGLTLYSSDVDGQLVIHSGAYETSVTHQNMLGLPYVTINANGYNHVLQNGYAAFAYLQQYYAYDMPARNYKINGVSKTALGVKKLKTQDVSFPQITEPDLQQLVKTNLGNGKIRKMSLNLSSRNAETTLEYDTE